MKNKKSISVLANAKINLNLEVLNRRADGYHNISSLFQSVTLSDSVTVTVSDGNGISIITKNADITGDNLAKKAVEIFLEQSRISAEVTVTIDKRIPLSAGLAGGSADAAAVLVSLNQLFDKPFNQDKLLELGLKLGADVPFCIIGGTKLVTGVGEKLSPAPKFPHLLVVLIKHHNKASTGAMYNLLDDRKEIKPPATDKIIKHLENDELEKAAPLFINSFLEVSADNDEQQAICERLKAAGAILTGLSGSGPTVFGLFDFYDGDMLNLLKHDYKEVYLCETAENGIEFE